MSTWATLGALSQIQTIYDTTRKRISGYISDSIVSHVLCALNDKRQSVGRSIAEVYDGLLQVGGTRTSEWRSPPSFVLTPLSMAILALFPVNASEGIQKVSNQRTICFAKQSYVGLGTWPLIAQLYTSQGIWYRRALHSSAFKIVFVKQLAEYFGMYPDDESGWHQVMSSGHPLLVFNNCESKDRQHSSLASAIVTRSVLHGYDILSVSHAGVEEILYTVFDLHLPSMLSDRHCRSLSLRIPVSYSRQYIHVTPICMPSHLSDTLNPEERHHQQRLLAMDMLHVQNLYEQILISIEKGYDLCLSRRANDPNQLVLAPLYRILQSTLSLFLQLLQFILHRILCMNAHLRKQMAALLLQIAFHLDPEAAMPMLSNESAKMGSKRKPRALRGHRQFLMK